MGTAPEIDLSGQNEEKKLDVWKEPNSRTGINLEMSPTENEIELSEKNPKESNFTKNSDNACILDKKAMMKISYLSTNSQASTECEEPSRPKNLNRRRCRGLRRLKVIDI